MINSSLFSSGNNEYTTPKKVLDYFGPFKLDLCCTPYNKVCDNGCYDMYALPIRYYGRIWCNPPYSTKLQNDAVDICLKLAEAGNTVFLLVPCRMNSKRFNKILNSGLCSTIYFPNRRLEFGNTNAGAPFDCMIIRLCHTPCYPMCKPLEL